MMMEMEMGENFYFTRSTNRQPFHPTKPNQSKTPKPWENKGFKILGKNNLC